MDTWVLIVMVSMTPWTIPKMHAYITQQLLSMEKRSEEHKHLTEANEASRDEVSKHPQLNSKPEIYY